LEIHQGERRLQGGHFQEQRVQPGGSGYRIRCEDGVGIFLREYEGAGKNYQHKKRGNNIVSKVKKVALSFGDGMLFASYTVLPTIGIMWATGIVSLNI